MRAPMDRRAFLARIAACSAAPLVAGCLFDDGDSLDVRLRAAVERVIERYQIPGAQVSVRYPGEPEWKEAFGYADVARRRAFAPTTYVSIRSITKSFTVTMILQLVREGALRLTDVLQTFVAGFPNGTRISIADLAGMQSGIANYTKVPAFLAQFVQDLEQPFTDAQIVGYAIPASPVFAPGAQYEYCNTNTILLGTIVEKLTGLSFAAALKQRILDPLALTGTSFPTVVALPDPHPIPYAVDIVTGALEELPYVNPTALSSAGGMVSTIDDLQTWAQALGTGVLIGATLQAERVARNRVVTNGPRYDRYGLGLGILSGWWGHTGSALGWTATTFYDPRTTATIATAVNATPDGGDEDLNFAEEIFKELAVVIASWSGL